MDALLPGSSILAAFIGGMVALAAPCCITSLPPSYLAGVYQARVAVLALTFVFGLGIAAVILPIALGVSALSRLVSEWHTEVFILGGVFLLFLGTWSIIGRNLPPPHSPRQARCPLPFRSARGPNRAAFIFLDCQSFSRAPRPTRVALCSSA